MGAGRATGLGGTVPRGERRWLTPTRGKAIRKGLVSVLPFAATSEPRTWLGSSGSSIHDCGNENE